ncbi:MAG TPA: exo-alpha-sialidase [Bacteroidetes bacterium]|nr:exo-alpha-sialidase [Bacteroidota bacterium]
MKYQLTFFFSLLFLFVFSCKNEKKTGAQQDGTKNHSTIKQLKVPSRQGGEPNLVADKNGGVYLSWVEYADDTTDVLVYSKLTANGWDQPEEIARGSDWFVNWADFPSLVIYDDGAMAAHWLQISAAGTYDYDVMVSQKTNAASGWGKPFKLNQDGVAAEHGFVSMIPAAEGKIFAAWLDGRNTKSGGDGDGGHGHGHGGAMTIRAAFFDQTGRLSNDTELDNRTCDCCQTSAVGTSDGGVLVAYRDRSEDEVRDIYFTKMKDGKWSAPQPVFADNWKITGCPVNGPSLAATGGKAVIAWFTAANKSPKANIAFSNDNGDTFGLPIRFDDGEPAGRIDVLMLNANEALVSWLENTEDGAEIRAKKIKGNGQMEASFLVAKTSPSRASGFPRMVAANGKIIFAWTGVEGDSTFIKSGAL